MASKLWFTMITVNVGCMNRSRFFLYSGRLFAALLGYSSGWSELEGSARPVKERTVTSAA